MSVPDEDYSRTASWTLNLISTLSLLDHHSAKFILYSLHFRGPVWLNELGSWIT